MLNRLYSFQEDPDLGQIVNGKASQGEERKDEEANFLARSGGIGILWLFLVQFLKVELPMKTSLKQADKFDKDVPDPVAVEIPDPDTKSSSSSAG